MVLSARRLLAVVLRPYAWREFPGWGAAVRLAGGGHQYDRIWRDAPPRLVRGKVHGQLMELDIRRWSNRLSWFLGRFYDLPTQLVVGGLLEKGDTFVDVGANEGMITLVASVAVGSNGSVIDFEPNPVPRAKLEANLARNNIRNVTVIAAGAAEVAASLPLFVPAANTGEGSFALDGQDDREGTIVECPVVTADAALEGVTPTLIKIDVEGYEEQVLRGATQVIARALPIFILEMVKKHNERAGSTMSSICDLLFGKGYRAYRIVIDGSVTKYLDFRPLVMTEPWIDGDYMFVPEGKVDATLAKLRGMTMSKLASKLSPA